MPNNINALTFDNHDTYIYYSTDWFKNEQTLNLIPTNPEDKDIVRYSSDEVDLFTNGVKNGLLKINTFLRLNQNITTITTISTMITNDGILMFNFAGEINSSFLAITGTQTKTLATYKSGKYANYINVQIQTDIEDGYRKITISY